MTSFYPNYIFKGPYLHLQPHSGVLGKDLSICMGGAQFSSCTRKHVSQERGKGGHVMEARGMEQVPGQPDQERFRKFTEDVSPKWIQRSGIEPGWPG